MTDIFSLLSMGGQALLTHQKAIYVTGNNITNVNTPGYSRERVTLEPGTPTQTASGSMGSGVRANEVERIYDRFLGVQINDESQSLGREEAYKDGVESVEAIFNETDGNGLSRAMSEFWNAWYDLANNPSGQAERVTLSAKGESLADTFNSKYADLVTQQQDVDARIQDAVDQINGLSQQVADLNQKIVEIEAGGQQAAAYRDQRDQVLKEMSSYIDINTIEDATGSVSVSVGSSRSLVDRNQVWQLDTQTNADGLEQVVWRDSSGNGQDITAQISGGKLNGWLDVRDNVIGDFRDRLDNLAQTLMDEVNGLHAAGFGLDGSTGNAFFSGAGTAGGVMDSALTITAEDGSRGNITVTLVGGGTAGSETVTTDPATGNIQVAIEDGVSTGAQIAAALESQAAIHSAVATSPATPWTLGGGSDTVTLTGGASAAGIEVNPDILDDVNRIAAASTAAGVPGDNSNAIAIAGLQQELLMEGGTATLDAYYQSLVSDSGTQVQRATAQYSHESDMMTYLENYRDSVSGVSLDEEMVNLMKSQNAYDAAAKLVSTADELMQTVLNMI
jgi:flagellar hook-associated protein 1 FlgK